MFRVAVSGRREQEPSFSTVIVWRHQPEHAAESLAKGSQVVVVGRLQQRAWTAEDGSTRSTVEVMAEELGPSNCAGRRQPRPGRRAAKASSQLDQRCDGVGQRSRSSATGGHMVLLDLLELHECLGMGVRACAHKPLFSLISASRAHPPRNPTRQGCAWQSVGRRELP